MTKLTLNDVFLEQAAEMIDRLSKELDTLKIGTVEYDVTKKALESFIEEYLTYSPIDNDKDTY